MKRTIIIVCLGLLYYGAALFITYLFKTNTFCGNLVESLYAFIWSITLIIIAIVEIKIYSNMAEIELTIAKICHVLDMADMYGRTLEFRKEFKHLVQEIK